MKNICEKFDWQEIKGLALTDKLANKLETENFFVLASPKLVELGLYQEAPVIILPKFHIEWESELSEEEIAEKNELILKVSEVIKKAYGVMFVSISGPGAEPVFKEVSHFYFSVFSEAGDERLHLEEINEAQEILKKEGRESIAGKGIFGKELAKALSE